ncbi:MAG TPA: hypothetical protein VMJ35_15385 [Dongiaceae bacterium]|nr:hypothetical protein [Dongiaceae bacterium]
MTDNRKAGLALIAGSLGGVLTMAIHPTAGGPLTPEQVSRLALVSGVAHSIAIVSLVVLFLGACGLAKNVAAPDQLSFAAIVIFAFACVAIFIAATVSGFIIPAIMRRMAQHIPADQTPWQVAITSIFQINQAFSRIYSVAASLAIILWSLSSLRNGGLNRGIAIYGCVIAIAIIVAVSSGHLHLDVHGMAAVWFAQALWFTLSGFYLWARPDVPSLQTS